jgi:hypothetical protein
MSNNNNFIENETLTSTRLQTRLILIITPEIQMEVKELMDNTIYHRTMDLKCALDDDLPVQYGIRWFERRVNELSFSDPDFQFVVKPHSSCRMGRGGEPWNEFYFTVHRV